MDMNLGKDNFWNEMHGKYPAAVELFKEWIDGYKKEVEWRSLFRPEVKFHDIPYEMQMGIMNRFFIEAFAGPEEYAQEGRAVQYRAEMVHGIKKLNIKLISDDQTRNRRHGV
jgi:hypothetical protein